MESVLQEARDILPGLRTKSSSVEEHFIKPTEGEKVF